MIALVAFLSLCAGAAVRPLVLSNGWALPSASPEALKRDLASVAEFQICQLSLNAAAPSGSVRVDTHAFLIRRTHVLAMSADELVWCESLRSEFKLAHALSRDVDRVVASFDCGPGRVASLTWPADLAWRASGDEATDCFAVVRVRSWAGVLAVAAMPEVLWVDRFDGAPLRDATTEAARIAQAFSLSPGAGELALFSAAGLSGADVTVNVIDGGLAMRTCFFNESGASFAFDAMNAAARKVIYYDSTYGDTSEKPGDTHGTSMAAIATGVALDSFPLASESNRHRGVAHASKLVFTDIDAGQGKFAPTNFSVLFQAGVAAGATIFSCSFSDDTLTYTEQDRQIDLFANRHPTSLVVASAGNGEPISWAAKNVLVVGASLTSVAARQTICGRQRFLVYVNGSPRLEIFGTQGTRGRAIFLNETLARRVVYSAALSSPCTQADLGSVDVFDRFVLVDRSPRCSVAQMMRLLELNGAAGGLLVHNDTSTFVYDLGELATLSIYTWVFSQADGGLVKQAIVRGDDVRLYVRFDLNVRCTATASEEPGALSSFSSRGPLADRRLAPHIVAVGESLRTMSALGEQCGNNAMILQTGTSPATALVAGAAALVRQYFGDGFFPTGSRNAANRRTASGALVRAVLIHAGVPREREATPNTNVGFGHLRLQRALKIGSRGPSAMFLVDGEQPVSGTVRQRHFCVRVTGDAGIVTEPLRASLVWTDPAGMSAMATTVLLNNLDLTLTNARTNETFIGNGALYGGVADRANNLEQATVPGSLLEVGHTWRVTVHAINFAAATSQAFALFVTGSFELTTCSSSDVAFCANRCSSAGSCDIVFGRCQCNAGCTGSDCSASSTAGGQVDARCPTAILVAPPSVPLATPPTPVPTVPPTPSLVSPILPAECVRESCGLADGTLDFGAVNSPRWCRCCAANCFDFRRDCVANDFFCEAGGTCTSQFAALCAALPPLPSPRVTPAPTPLDPCASCQPFGLVNSNNYCSCCANDCSGLRDKCRAEGFCTSTCLTTPLCVAEAMLTTMSRPTTTTSRPTTTTTATTTATVTTTATRSAPTTTTTTVATTTTSGATLPSTTTTGATTTRSVVPTTTDTSRTTPTTATPTTTTTTTTTTAIPTTTTTTIAIPTTTSTTSTTTTPTTTESTLLSSTTVNSTPSSTSVSSTASSTNGDSRSVIFVYFTQPPTPVSPPEIVPATSLPTVEPRGLSEGGIIGIIVAVVVVVLLCLAGGAVFAIRRRREEPKPKPKAAKRDADSHAIELDRVQLPPTGDVVVDMIHDDSSSLPEYDRVPTPTLGMSWATWANRTGTISAAEISDGSAATDSED
jgi:hypothetical protein